MKGRPLVGQPELAPVLGNPPDLARGGTEILRMIRRAGFDTLTKSPPGYSGAGTGSPLGPGPSWPNEPPPPPRPNASRASYWGFLLLPKDKRAALSAVYEYCRLIDDIVDSGSLNKKEAQRMLDFWKEEVERIYNGTPTNSLSERLLAHIKKFHLPKQPFLEVIRGCEMDLTVSRYETFEELESYLQGVACAVGDLSVEIFGYSFTSPSTSANSR